MTHKINDYRRTGSRRLGLTIRILRGRPSNPSGNGVVASIKRRAPKGPKSHPYGLPNAELIRLLELADVNDGKFQTTEVCP